MPSLNLREGFGPELGAGGAPVRLGIMGGTFDPLHNGHIACAVAACAACGIEKVLFIPTGRPNFKQGRNLASGYERLEMCRVALADEAHRFEVCDIEIRRPGVTYAVDTLRALRAAYPANVELCFIMGADSAKSLPRWYESADLAELATYIAASRPGFALDDEAKAGLAAAGFTMEYVEDLEYDLSSSDIRERLAAGDSVEGMVPDAIRELVESCETYLRPETETQQAPSEVLSAEFFEEMTHEVSSRVSEKRFAHICGVADTAAELARFYGVDEQTARLAGLLHDWDKGYDNASIRARVQELGLDAVLDPWVVEQMPQVLHAHTAATALSREYPQIPSGIIQAIDRHTVADENMTPLDMVIYIADAIEPNRQFGRIDFLRATVGKVSLEELFFLTYEYWTYLLLEKRRQMHPDTIKIWNAYVARRAARKGR